MLKIRDRNISIDNPPYIIAELSANHGRSINNAKQAIRSAKKCGANAVKIQTYTPDTMTIASNKPAFKIKDGLWQGRALYDLYKEAHLPLEWHQELFKTAKETGITLFSTPFDETAVDFLQKLDAPAYKIASFEIVDLPLIQKAAECKKPLLMSTGMANLREVAEAVNVALKYGSGEILLFHCISSYPAMTTESHLKNIKFLRKEFSVEVGLSDHTISNIASMVAVGLGATAIEKHFKPNNNIESPDSSFSITPKQLVTLVDDCHEAWAALGEAGFNRSTSENDNLKYRRSIYFVTDLKKGQQIKETDIRIIRPGYGLLPKYFKSLIGKTLSVDVERGDPVSLKAICK